MLTDPATRFKRQPSLHPPYLPPLDSEQLPRQGIFGESSIYTVGIMTPDLGGLPAWLLVSLANFHFATWSCTGMLLSMTGAGGFPSRRSWHISFIGSIAHFNNLRVSSKIMSVSHLSKIKWMKNDFLKYCLVIGFVVLYSYKPSCLEISCQWMISCQLYHVSINHIIFVKIENNSKSKCCIII